MKYIFLILITIMALLGCSTTLLTEEAKDTIVLDYIAENELTSQDIIRRFRLNSWYDLSDRYIVFNASPSKHVIVELDIRGRCSQVTDGMNFGIRQVMTDQLRTRTDYVYSPEFEGMRCNVKEIYPMTKEQFTALKERFTLAEERLASNQETDS